MGWAGWGGGSGGAWGVLGLMLVLLGWWLWSRAREKRRNAAMLDALKPDPVAAERDEMAAKLLANYMMSEEGNQVFNADPGAFTVYDTSKLPKEYEPPKAGTSARRAEIAKLLGF